MKNTKRKDMYDDYYRLRTTDANNDVEVLSNICLGYRTGNEKIINAGG